jgi:heme exporter protein B
MKHFLHLLQQQLRVLWRNRQEMWQPLFFCGLMISLFAVAFSHEPTQLRALGAPLIWLAAILSSLLSLERLFRSDYEHGLIEQQLVSPYPLMGYVLAKLMAHWLTNGLLLVLLSPLLATALLVPSATLPALLWSLLLGTPALSAIGALGAALTVGLPQGGLLLSLLILPLTIPVLIFALAALEASAAQLPFQGQLALLAAFSISAVVLAPWAIAASLKIHH